MQNLKIALVQTSIFWESYQANLDMFEEKLDLINHDVDLIVLPEMFSTGFSMRPEILAQTIDGDTVNWLIKKSKEKSADIVGSVIIEENKKYYNRLVWVKASGIFEVYDKKHLFGYAGEAEFYSPGKQRIVVDCCGWQISPFICYDLRFPVWSRNFNNEYDVALFVANWPAIRSYSWKQLLIARAIENQCYVVGLNRVGVDGNGVEYTGDSSVINPTGTLISFSSVEESIISTSLSYDFLRKTRHEFPFWKDADTDFRPHEFDK